MYLREVAVYADADIVDRFPSGFVGWFHRETCCITELYRALLGKKLATADTVKVTLDFVEQTTFAPSVNQLLNVADGRWFFAFSRYVLLDTAGKKRMICDEIRAALLWIAGQRGWDSAGLEECYVAALDRNLCLNGWSKKSWLCPNGRHRARIGFTFELREVEFCVGIFDRRGRELGRKRLGSIRPEIGIADSVLKGRGRWLRGRVFRLDLGSAHFYVPKSWEVDVSDLLS